MVSNLPPSVNLQAVVSSIGEHIPELKSHRELVGQHTDR